jgi:hypothetical protein
MTDSLWPETVELSDFLSDLDPVQLKVRVPAPAVVLLADLMARIPRRVSIRNTGELVAALLVHAATRQPNDLGKIVGDYRETQAHQVLPTDATAGEWDMPPRADLGF